MMRKVKGHPHLRKDSKGVVHNIDTSSLAAAQKAAKESHDIQTLKKEVAELKAIIKNLTQKH